MTLRNVSLGVVIVDQISKYLIVRFCQLNQPVVLVHDFLYLTYVQNPGAAFGFMAATNPLIRIPFFIFITLGAGLIIYAYQRFLPPEKKVQRLALGLIWGGAMGNFIDRVVYRRVVDFIDVEHLRLGPVMWRGHFYGPFHFPWIFNGADSCITVGITLLILSYLLEKPAPPAERF